MSVCGRVCKVVLIRVTLCGLNSCYTADKKRQFFEDPESSNHPHETKHTKIKQMCSYA